MYMILLMRFMFVLCKFQPVTVSTKKWDLIEKQLHKVHPSMTGLEFIQNHRNRSSMQEEYDWNVMDILQGTFSAMILNTPIINPKFAISIWKKGNFKILVDGGGNRLYDVLFNKTSDDGIHDLPNVLCGDFDSVREDVLDFFRNLDVQIIHTPDQNEPDFFKALRILSENTDDRVVVVYCDNVGRLDHIMQNLNTLFKCSSHETLNKYNIFLMNDRSLTWLLEPGSHIIHVPQHLWTDRSHCGLMPVGQPCYHVTTRGLKYNLSNGEMRFGKMVSSSNAYDMASNETEVHISTDNKLIWTMNVDERICT